MLTARRWFVWGAAVLAAFPVVSQAAHLRGRVLRVGFPASGQDLLEQGTDHYRPGRWTPVLVELTNDDGDLFDGSIEVRQTDRDGDEVVAREEVAVRGTRRFFLYVPAGVFQRDFSVGAGQTGARSPFAVRVFDRDGRLAPLFDDSGQPIGGLIPARL